MSTERISAGEDNDIIDIIEMADSEKEYAVEHALSSLKLFSEKREYKKKLVTLGALRPIVKALTKVRNIIS